MGTCSGKTPHYNVGEILVKMISGLAMDLDPNFSAEINHALLTSHCGEYPALIPLQGFRKVIAQWVRWENQEDKLY